MAMNFPDSPTTGQTFSVSGGPTYSYDGAKWRVLTPGNSFARTAITATAGQTSFSVVYTVGAIDVFQNGVKLVSGSDFTATTGTTIVLTNGANAGDTIEVVSYSQITYTAVSLTSNVTGTLPVANGGTGLTSLGTGVTTALGNAVNGASGICVLDASGNLGLGVTPSAWYSTAKAIDLNTTGSVATFTNGGIGIYCNAYLNTSAQNIYKISNYAGYYQLQPDTGRHVWFTAPSGIAGNAITFTPAMTLTAGGNLGIGTTSPTVTLQTAGALAVQGPTGYPTSGGGWELYVADTANVYLQAYNRTSNSYAYTANYNALAHQFKSQGNNAVLIDSSGNLLVGTTSNTIGRLVVKAKNDGYGGIQVVRGDNSGDYWTQNIDGLVGYTWAKNGADFWYAGRSGSNNCVSVNGSWVNSSDERLKNNIASLTDALSKVLQLRGVSFNRKSNGASEIGLIAQEVMNVYPEAIEDSGEYYGLNYGALVGPLIEAIRELAAKVSALEAKQ